MSKNADPYLTRADFAAWTKKFSEWRKAADERHEEQRKDLNVALARISQLENRKAHPQQAAAATVATDADLDGKYGDPDVKRNPPRWDGDDMTGRRFSQTSAAFLAEMASFKDWCAEQDDQSEDEKQRGNAKWRRIDAARARGWAKRLASGWKAEREEDPPEADGDPDPDPFNGSEDDGGDLVHF